MMFDGKIGANRQFLTIIFRLGAGGGGIKIIVFFYDLIGIRMGASMLPWSV
jgi:hypothetical protein